MQDRRRLTEPIARAQRPAAMGTTRPTPDEAARKVNDLLQAYERRVLAYAVRRTSSVADAEDAAAETFTVAWRKIDQVPVDALPWLLAVARRAIANQRRARNRRAWLVSKLGRQASPAPLLGGTGDPGHGPALAVLARMRADDRELLGLVAWDELDQQSIGRILGISSNAVAIRLHRARKRFRDELMKDPRPNRTGTEVKSTINGAAQERIE